MIFKTFKEDINKLRCHFGFRAFIKLFAGVALLAANSYFFVASAIHAFFTYSILKSTMGFIFGVLGFCVSCFLIVLLSLHYAANSSFTKTMKPSKESSTALGEALSYQGKHRKKRILLVISIYVVIWAVAIGTLSYYFVDKVKYRNYLEVEATISTVYDDGMVSCKYTYIVDGKTYTAMGSVKHGGETIPQTGDIVTIKYNPDNPEDIYISVEKIFFLGFGLFFLFAAVLLVIVEIKKLPTTFLLAYITIGLTAVIGVIMLTGYQPKGIIDFLGNSLWFHFVLIFGNVGLIMLANGIIDLVPQK